MTSFSSYLKLSKAISQNFRGEHQHQVQIGRKIKQGRPTGRPSCRANSDISVSLGVTAILIHLGDVGDRGDIGEEAAGLCVRGRKDG